MSTQWNPKKLKKLMLKPIHLVYKYFQSKAKVEVWLYENKVTRIEGKIIGFDEYMNMVLDEAEEVNIKTGKRKEVGRIMLKGDNVTLICNITE
ncbi:unnamed protein product [Moneuplotes crassus]|uniref:Small nuclear ribonucleoprotein E n=1 Tax=Euplotes crassus TaxID=5936 RepID=A0AAD1Y667_EUPCR|nr:unnamed protein product [Moneuplotes crassus]